jgi:hypothetical protein|tara:strand:+ start:633 stop:1508 length:876 start_codon:yes stop_codon:yes gene_type:complete
MKKNYVFTLALVIGIGLVSWQKSSSIQTSEYKKSHRFTSGAPNGKTGAPGESNCTDCHTGSVMAGSSENIFTVAGSTGAITTYVPGQTYQIELAMASNPAKKGMQVTVLDANNSFAGSFTPAAGGVNFTMGGGKTYANHSAASTTTSFPFWNWQWTAPATNVGPVTFYVATNVANNNGQNTGDVIHISNHTFNGVVGLEENSIESVKDFRASFSAENSMVYIQFSSLINGSNFVNIVDMTGKSVLNMDIGASSIGINKESVRLPEHIKNGMYIVQFFVDNYPMSQSILVKR